MARPSRRQVNMKPETEKMVSELLEHLRDYGPQPDIKASELFDALITLLHNSRAQLDLSTVPSRGQWGSPTADAFPAALAHAFAAAIRVYYRE